MRHELSTLELRILSKELNAVTGYYIDQFYQLGDKRFRMKLSSKEGKANLNIEIPNYVALSNMGEISDEATGFAMAVRKRISGSRISSIGLLSRDRILSIGVERKEWKGLIIIEMFGRGNLIVTDDKMEILLALQTHEFTDREVRKGAIYKPPRNDCVDLDDKGEVMKVFASVKEAPEADRLAAYLARKLGVGGLYVEDALVKEGLEPKSKIREVKQETVDRIRDRIIKVIESSGNAILYLKDGRPEEVAVAEIAKYSALEKREMPLNQAVELFYSSRPREEPGANEEVERIEASLKKQDEIIGNMKKEEVACRAKGDFISARIGPVNELIRATAGKKLSDDDLKSISAEFTVKRIDRAKRAIMIETDGSK
jgi:predicted ribosome quality control (RQC) complex YloA/Tae2 family protein